MHRIIFLLSAANEFKDKTEFVHQMWQTDFTYFKVIGWGWYYLSTVLDDYSRYIIHWELCDSMKAEDVKRTVTTAIEKAKLKSKAKPKYSQITVPAMYQTNSEPT